MKHAGWIVTTLQVVSTLIIGRQIFLQPPVSAQILFVVVTVIGFLVYNIWLAPRAIDPLYNLITNIFGGKIDAGGIFIAVTTLLYMIGSYLILFASIAVIMFTFN